MYDKKRLLITISFSFSIRYLYRTGLLHKLREFVTPVIAITWNEPELVEEMRNEGFEVHVVPESYKDPLYSNIRRKIDYWFRGFALKSESKTIQNNYLDQYIPLRTKVKRKVRERYNHAKFFIPGYRSRIFHEERKLLETHTNYKEMLVYVDRLNIDAVFTPTPFQTQEDILLRACKDKGKKMLTAILSFDNLTKRGWIPVAYDYYMVWNKHNYREALTIYPQAATEKNVKVTGAAQFDFYFDNNYLLPKKEWRKIVGLPSEDYKVILYAGGPQRLFPNEPQYLKHILEAMDNKQLCSNTIILFRCHPIDNVERWKEYLGNHPNLFYDISWTGKEKLQAANLTKGDIYKLCSTLAYTDVHINLCSTMTVDGCAYNKPQIGPAYDDVNPSKAHLLKNMYYQDHFLPVVETQGLRLAESKEELINSVNEALEHPGKFTRHCQQILEEIITYTDGKCTDRLVACIKEQLVGA